MTTAVPTVTEIIDEDTFNWSVLFMLITLVPVHNNAAMIRLLLDI
ncbi:hypothetical protein [Clostridium aceticum]|nr:hypothetical protein [Clostridium aceticum]